MKGKPYNVDIFRSIRKRGYELIRHELVPFSVSPFNCTGIYVLKPRVETSKQLLGCPSCKGDLTAMLDNFLFCESCGVAYPVLQGIPCLRPEHGILATHLRSAMALHSSSHL